MKLKEQICVVEEIKIDTCTYDYLRLVHAEFTVAK